MDQLTLEDRDRLGKENWPISPRLIWGTNTLFYEMERYPTWFGDRGLILSDGEGFDVQILEPPKVDGADLFIRVWVVWCLHRRGEVLWDGCMTYETKEEFIRHAVLKAVPTPKATDIGHGFFGIWCIQNISMDQGVTGCWLQAGPSKADRIEFESLVDAVEGVENRRRASPTPLMVAQIGRFGEPIFPKLRED